MISYHLSIIILSFEIFLSGTFYCLDLPLVEISLVKISIGAKFVGGRYKSPGEK